jgi:hypothetical protein
LNSNHENGNEDKLVDADGDGDDYDDYDNYCGQSDEEKIEGEFRAIPLNLVSGIRMLNRLTMSLPSHREQTSYMSRR